MNSLSSKGGNGAYSGNLRPSQKWPSCGNLQSAHREADLRALGEAQAIEASSRQVHLRIDRRTVIVAPGAGRAAAAPLRRYAGQTTMKATMHITE